MNDASAQYGVSVAVVRIRTLIFIRRRSWILRMETVPISTTKTVSKAPLPRALRHLATLQNAPGHWEAEMVWNSMLLSQYVLTRRMVDSTWPLPLETVKKILKHYEVTRLP